MTEEELINLTNALSFAMDNNEGSSSDVDVEITRDDAEQTDITVSGKRISIVFKRPDSTRLTRPGSLHGLPNPLVSHPPTPPPHSPSSAQTPPRSPRPRPTPSTCKDGEHITCDDWVALFPSPPALPPPSSPSYSPFPAPIPLPPKWFKHVRFSLTPSQIHLQQTQTPKPRLRESQVIYTSSLYDEDDDDGRAKSVKFVLTQEQIQREGETREKLVESEVVAGAEFQDVELVIGKVEVLKSVVKHVLRRAGKGKVFKVTTG